MTASRGSAATTSSVVVSSGGGVSGADVERARDAVGAVRSLLPYPDPVVACLVQRVAVDGGLLDAVRRAPQGSPGEEVLGVLASCAVAVDGAPRFVEGLESASGGGLSAGQRRCATEAYEAMTPGELQAVSGAALNPGGGGGAGGALAGLLERCDIDVKAGD